MGVLFHWWIRTGGVLNVWSLNSPLHRHQHNEKANFPRISWFPRNQPGLYSLGPSVIWLFCNMTWYLELSRLNYLVFTSANTLCNVLFNVFSGIDTKNRMTLSNFAIRLLTSQRYKETSHFLLWKVKHLQVLFFSLEQGFYLNWFLLLALFIQDTFFGSGARTLNMDKTDSIACRRSVYLFILPTNTINQICAYMYIWITAYLIS